MIFSKHSYNNGNSIINTSNTFIDDGYTRDDGYIAGSKPNDAGDRLYDPLEFSYRVATRREWILLDDQIAKLSRAEPVDSWKIETLVAEFVVKHVKSWSLKKRGIHEAEVTVENALGMHAGLFSRLYLIIRGSALSDPKPDTPEKTPPSDAALLGNSDRVSGSGSGTPNSTGEIANTV